MKMRKWEFRNNQKESDRIFQCIRKLGIEFNKQYLVTQFCSLFTFHNRTYTHT